jgi:signal transduction histidine kinase
VTPESFLTLANLLPEALILATDEGILLAANPPARQLLSLDSRPLDQQPLTAWVAGPPEKLFDFLRLCARSRSLVPGALSLRALDHTPEASFYVEGAVVQPRSSQTAASLLLRWRTHQQGIQKFTELNEQIERLSQEMFLQKKMAEEFDRLYQEVQQLNTGLEQRVADRTTELERSLQELNQFTYIASHDLKAPLRSIKHLANWIIEDAGELLPEASKVYLAKMQGRIRRMEKFLDDLLIYSRLGRDYYQGQESLHTGALLTEIIEVLAPPPSFTITVQENMPTLTAHRLLLELIFKNLIENGVKHHHRAEGQIQVSAQDLPDAIEFSVTDDGPGIAPEFHDRIFEIFQTLRPRDEIEGTGAGLALVKRAIESQGGTIRVISAEGQGTTFHFTWPKN